jgi:hypothetical protein
VKIDRFSIHCNLYANILRCDVCHALDHFDDPVYAWSVDEDMNLGALLVYASEHWDTFHARLGLEEK